MALINPKTGSSKFNVIIRRNAVVSLAGEAPVIVSEEEEFTLKLVSDVISGEEIKSSELQEVPDSEINADGIWVKAAAAQLKNLSQDELIQMLLAMQAQTGAELPIANATESAATEPEADPEVEEAPKPKKKRKKPTPEAVTEGESEGTEVTIPAASTPDEDEVDVEF